MKRFKTTYDITSLLEEVGVEYDESWLVKQVSFQTNRTVQGDSSNHGATDKYLQTLARLITKLMEGQSIDDSFKRW